MTERDPQLVQDGEAAARALSEHPADARQELFGIRDLAKEFGITPRAIRFYEDKGLLAPQRVNNSRVYSRRERARLALILRGKAIGCSLSEIAHYLELYGEQGKGRRAQLEFVIERTQQEIDALETRKAHLEAQLERLRWYNESARGSLGELE
ncbi:MAG: MerR family DNA-binding transcriptional regulator [Myxococcota bacterium]|nr:MerR family DNA-binding transcriptional regulator [Myxococcota bacterium]